MLIQLVKDIRANYSKRTPYLKFLRELLYYLLYITCRNVFRTIQRGWWKINGTARTLSKIREGNMYNKAAHVQKIVWRGKADILCITRFKDFISVHERFDDPRCILADNVTLYSVGHHETTFVETPPKMDIHHSKNATFLFMAQFLFAVKTITIPNWAFKKLADEVGDPAAEVTFLANTGRCGSTILSQMFEACPGVLSLSEPDAFTNFDVLKLELPEDEYKSLLRSSVRLLCKPQAKTNIKYVLIKTRSESVRHVPAISELFPSINLLFMYRDRMETVRSMDHAFSAILVYWLLYIFQASSVLRKLFPKQVARCRYFCFGDEESTSWMRNSDKLSSSMTIFYYLCMHHCWVIRKYYDFQEEGIDIPAVKYEDMISSPARACKAVFNYCGLPDSSIPKAVKAMENDSQRASPLAIDVKQKRKRHDVTPEVLEICDKFCQRSGIPTFSENATLPRTISMMEKVIKKSD
ncbi:uncharacterized protein LOC135488245 [Lineus longissimus]|uniref:uncharacterized protein LOC135488245 n=1 Tax=Lineus longissimus TaxID=88925 RepID=UPI00315DF6C8